MHKSKPVAVEPLVYSIETLSQILSVSKSAIYKMIAAGKFPRPRSLMGRSVRWDAGEVRQWLQERPYRAKYGESGGISTETSPPTSPPSENL